MVGKIKSVDLEVPNKYGTYTVDVMLDDVSEQAFDQVWKSGRLATGLDLVCPLTTWVSPGSLQRWTPSIEMLGGMTPMPQL